MKEALKTIASAWSVAFIVLFVIFNAADSTEKGAHMVWFFLLFGAVNGAGWLWYRSEAKNEEEDTE